MVTSMPRAAARPLAFLLPCLLVGACGLFQTNQLDFTSYPLEGVPFDEAVDLVNEVTERFFLDRFGGGFTIDWDDEDASLRVSEIQEGTRRLRMYIQLRRGPHPASTDVEMFALVEHLADSLTSAGSPWTHPQKDAPLEERLFSAYLQEAMARGLLEVPAHDLDVGG